MTLAGGCTRAFYLKQADKEVNDILAEKDKNPLWKIEQWHIFPDPRARFANPANPNRQPMPPDDEAVWKATPHPQGPGHAGIGRIENNTYIEMMRAWDAENRTQREALNPRPDDKGPFADLATAEVRAGAIQSLYEAPNDGDAGFMLDLDQTVQLAIINSRDYQTFREDLYLFALPVTQQRFSFAWQWAATEDAIRQYARPRSLVGPQNNWTANSNIGVSKLFSTGALLTVGFANSTVLNFRNAANGLTTQSTINLDLVQPLLQGGGKAVTLEPLTASERNLFYAIRGYARFREQFYASIAFGSALPVNLASVSGASTTGTPISTLAALGFASTDVGGVFRGYLPSLFRQLDLAVDRKYVKDLEKAFLLFQGFQEGGQIAPLQVQQVESTMLNARAQVLSDFQNSMNSLDQFKQQIGIPANAPLVLDDTPARPITKTLDRYYEVVANSNVVNQVIDKQDQLPPEKLRGALFRILTEHPAVQKTEFQVRLPKAWKSWESLDDKQLKLRLDAINEERQKLLDSKTDIEIKGGKFPQDQADRLRSADFDADLGTFEQTLRRYEAKPWEKDQNELTRRQSRIKLFRFLSYSAQVVLVWARNERVEQVTQSWPELPGVEVEGLDLLNMDITEAQDKVVQLALRNRWDLMNARGQVVDAWRQLAVTANGLLGVLNVQYHLDATTPPGGDRPLSFSAAAVNQELIINGQLPLVRIRERNLYRAALINYERARRSLINLEDSVAAQIRFDIRQLQLFAANYRIQQKVVESFYTQVENSLEVIVAPVDPDSLKASGTAGQANAAALTNQYLGALGSLNQAQTRMYSVWLSYLATRIQLFVDLERLVMDSRGVWIDGNGLTPNGPPLPGRSDPNGIRLNGLLPVQGSEPAGQGIRLLDPIPVP
jgi:hypothetical protein